MDPSQLLKGSLDLAVLAVLAKADSYGYDVLRQLRSTLWSELGDASVYGTLRRLLTAGALSTYIVPSETGPHRKYYALTDAGRRELEDGRKVWTTVATGMDLLLEPDQGRWHEHVRR
jgi:PadR family transcriptional regulator, regulatory protein PadR